MRENLTEAEVQIYEARCSGTSLGDQSEEDVGISLTGVLLKISIICGCPLPTHPDYVDGLESEFKKLIFDSNYEGLTVDEILTAFRMNANFKLAEKVEHYNRVFNIDYAAQVLRLYVWKRGNVDAAAEDLIFEINVKEELKRGEDSRRKKIIEQFKKYLLDENNELDLSDCYMQLRADGAFCNKSMSIKPIGEDVGSAGAKEFSRLLNSFPNNLDEIFFREKKAVTFLFKNMKLTNRLNVYDENLVLLNPGFELPEEMLPA